MVSIIIVSWKNPIDLRSVLTSLSTVAIPFEVIVVDNASTEATASVARSFPFVTTLIENKENTLYAHPNNQGYVASKGDYILLLNQDVVVLPDAIEAMMKFLDTNPSYGGVTTKLVNPDGSTQYYMHRRLPRWYHIPLGLLHKRVPAFLPNTIKRYLYLDKTFTEDFDIEQPAGACIMLRRSVIQQLGMLFDEVRFPLYYNDVDLARRLQLQGTKLRCLTSVSVRHGKGQSIKRLPKWRTLSWYFQAVWRYFTVSGGTSSGVK